MKNHRPGATVANGTEQKAYFDDDSEIVAVTLDPRPEIFDRIDGPILDLSDHDFEGMARVMRKILDHGTRGDHNSHASLETIGARFVCIAAIFLPDSPAGPEITRLYGLSKQSQSQYRKKFYEAVASVNSLRTRTETSRERMRASALESHRRRKEKGPEITPGLNEKAAPYTTSEQVNHVAGGAL